MIGRIVSESSYSTCRMVPLKSRRTTKPVISRLRKLATSAFFDAVGMSRTSWPKRTDRDRMMQRICTLHLPWSRAIACEVISQYSAALVFSLTDTPNESNLLRNKIEDLFLSVNSRKDGVSQNLMSQVPQSPFERLCHRSTAAVL
jgi:hypothetical protein